ncbi:MAG TPA: polysaccharide biosynthesis/export family protein [Bryobacteraceae bacterium]|jgi:polysaccharide export outer membrane protein|nr:polysaccharide biosynthesis/export family protein [Bryobacteraceae bacterium]
MRKVISVPALLATALCGMLGAQQAATPEQPSAPSQTATNKAQPAKNTAPDAKSPAGTQGVDPHAYIIGAEDVISIRVWREPENSGTFTVRPDGKVSVPLVGEIQAAGLTPEQLSESIAASLERVMVHPEVTVGVEKVNSKKYYIQGEVIKPGAYPLVIPTTILEALVNAGGFREFANTNKIVILRGGERLKFNYHQVTHGKNMAQNILLKPGDQIIVP